MKVTTVSILLVPTEYILKALLPIKLLVTYRDDKIKTISLRKNKYNNRNNKCYSKNS